MIYNVFGGMSNVALSICLSIHACGLRWGSEVLLSVNRPPGSVCRLYYERPSCHRTPSHFHWRRTCSRLPGTVETIVRDSSTGYKCPELLYLLTQHQNLFDKWIEGKFKKKQWAENIKKYYKSPWQQSHG